MSATTRNADPQRLAWDTEFWGVRVGRATHLDGLGDWAVENTMGLICLLVDTVGEAQDAQARGFRLMDVRVTLSRPAAMKPSSARLLRDEDVDALCTIARTAFPLTRFYADPLLDDDRCGDLYVEWTRSLCAGAADVVLVAERIMDVGDNRGVARTPVGYVTVSIDGGVAEIGLIAVADGLRGTGIGADLVRAAVDVAKVRGCHSIDVVTQGANIGALRTFEGCGFRITKTQLWLHRWYDA